MLKQEQEVKRETKRGKFSSKFGFIMAAAGSAVGVGNIWSFPTQAADYGGGAFVFVYLFFVAVLGYPMLVAEILIGRYGQGDPIKSLTKVSESKLQKSMSWVVGGSTLLVVSFIFTFYAIVSGWFIAFGLEPFAKLFGLTSFSSWLTGFSVSSNLCFTFIFSVLTLMIVSQGVEGGIEKWSKRLMPLLFVLLISLACYLLFQPGAMVGLKKYLVPDFEKLFKKDVLIGALGQSFFSLSLGAAVMMVYGSYLGREENVPKLAAQVTLLDTLVAILAGLLIVPAIYVAEHNGVKILTESGLLIDSDQLVFTVLPALFQTMGKIGFIVAPFFYLLMIVAALTSSISMLEAPVSFVAERRQYSRAKSLLLVGSLCFMVSALIILNFETLFSLVINVVTNYAQPLASLGVVLYVGWLWKRQSILKELSVAKPEIASQFFWKIWPWYIKVVCPLLVLLVMFQSF